MVFDNPILVGTITILIVILAVYLSYVAENGLPFVPTYNINVDVQSAGQLIKNADVRIGGARVGQVLTITPEPATRTWPHPFARLGLQLQRSLQPLPLDTRYQVRVASVLGGNYLEIIPGRLKLGLPDGGTFHLNTNPLLSHDIPFVDLDQALQTFGPKTKAGLRGALTELGDWFAGRGSQLNDSILSTQQLLPPLSRLLALLSAPGTRLQTFLSGAAATAGTLAPEAPTIDSLLSNGATTFDALTRGALGETITQLPPTELLSTTVLRNAQPVLADAASIVQALKPGAALLPEATNQLDAVIVAATPVFKLLPGLATSLGDAAGAIETLARDPATINTFKVLGENDLGTVSASAFIGLGAILKTVASAQFACNVAGLWARNFASALSEGDSSGTWLRFGALLDTDQTFQSATPAANLHLNYYPIQDSTQCQAGNEPYTGTQLIGNPPRTTTRVDNTTPPPGVLQRGEQAGLVP
jgi:ABC-type transporter Mla subunit MlaD